MHFDNDTLESLVEVHKNNAMSMVQDIVTLAKRNAGRCMAGLARTQTWGSCYWQDWP